jgi:hypothetical protein
MSLKNPENIFIFDTYPSLPLKLMPPDIKKWKGS